MKELGLRLNAKRVCFLSLQRTTFLGVVWDSTGNVGAPVTGTVKSSILSAVKRIRLGQSLTVKQFQRLLGLMAAASNVIPFVLLYMIPCSGGSGSKGFSEGHPFA